MVVLYRAAERSFSLLRASRIAFSYRLLDIQRSCHGNSFHFQTVYYIKKFPRKPQKRRQLCRHALELSYSSAGILLRKRACRTCSSVSLTIQSGLPSPGRSSMTIARSYDVVGYELRSSNMRHRKKVTIFLRARSWVLPVVLLSATVLVSACNREAASTPQN